MHMRIAGPKYGDFMLLWKTLLGSFTTPFYIWQWAVLICKLGKILFSKTAGCADGDFRLNGNQFESRKVTF